MEGTATTTGTVATYGAAATLQYKGSAAQTTGTEFPATFAGSGGVKIENASGVTLGAARTINASLTVGGTVANSVFNDGGFQLTCTGTLNLTSGAFKLGSAGGATTWPAFSARNIAAGTTVEYASGVAQAVSTTPSYQNLTFSGAGTKTPASGTLSVAGNWTVGSTTALKTSNPTVNVTGGVSGAGAITVGSNNLTVTGNWGNSAGTTGGAGAVILNGASPSVSTTTFNRLTISSSTGAHSWVT